MPKYELLQLRKEFTDKGIMICFNGPFSHSIIEEIGNAVRRYLEREEAKKDAVMDVFAVYIEQTQNVRNYMAARKFPAAVLDSAILVIARKDGKYAISSGNLIEKGDTPTLLARLERINGLDKAALKRLYKEQLRRELQPCSSGAGVGLIDIARRASEKLAYHFQDLDGSYDFFSLTVII